MKSSRILKSLRWHSLDAGVSAILAACALNALVGAGFYQAHRLDPECSTSAGVFIRVLANFFFLFGLRAGGEPLPRWKGWTGNRTLWLWSLFGVLTTATYYLAIPRIGAGLSLFLNSGSGIFVVALAPFLASQKAKPSHWVGVLGSFGGLYLLSAAGAATLDAWGAGFALFSGLFGGLAMLMVARGRKHQSKSSLMLHWATANLLFYLAWFMFSEERWPAGPAPLAMLIASGVAAAGSQYLSALAYQKAPASLVACLTYLGPVCSLALDVFVFRLPIGIAAMCGAMLVVTFGLVVPLWNRTSEGVGAQH